MLVRINVRITLNESTRLAGQTFESKQQLDNVSVERKYRLNMLSPRTGGGLSQPRTGGGGGGVDFNPREISRTTQRIEKR